MSAHDHEMLRLKALRWQLQYREDGDTSRYFSKCTMGALGLWLSEQNALRAKLGKAGHVLPPALNATCPLLMAAIDVIAGELSCPVNSRHTATEFISHFADTIQNRYESECLTPARKTVIEPVVNALRSLGLVS